MRGFKRMGGLLAMAALMAIASLLPSALLNAQDAMRSEQVTRGSRPKVSLENLEQNYEKSLHNRMSILAERLGDGDAVYVSETEASLTEDEREDIWEAVLQQDLFFVYMNAPYWREMGIYPKEISQNDPWKRYVFYDAQGILLVTYYIDLYLDKNFELRLLVDTEDNTIYYLQNHYQGDDKMLFDWIFANMNGTKVDSNAAGNEMAVRSAFYCWDKMMNVFYYYEVEFVDGTGYKDEFNYWEEINSRADVVESMFETETDIMEFLEEQYSAVWSEEAAKLEIPLVYGEHELRWEMHCGAAGSFEENAGQTFYQGIPDLAALVPEFRNGGAGE